MPGNPLGVEPDASIHVKKGECEVSVIAIEEEVGLIASSIAPVMYAHEIGTAHDGPGA